VRSVEAIAIAAGTLCLVVVRPRDLNEGVSALFGAILVLVSGLVPLHVAVRIEVSSWNVYLFFLGMMAIAALADQSGVFDLVAFSAARFARGRVAALYATVFLIGALISLLFANDSAALVLTPVVYALVMRLSLDPLPFVFATTFIADTASVGLPVSNPLNVIVVDAFHLDLGSYIAHLWLAALIVIIVNIIAFFIIFRGRLRGRFQPMSRPARGSGLASTIALLSVIAASYLVASAFLFSLGLVALVGATALALNLHRVGMLDLERLRTEMSWSIFGFIGGMLLIVRGLDSAGVTAGLGKALVHAAGTSHLAAIAVTVVGTAVGANLINNLPMALVMTTTIPPLHVPPATRHDLVYATILGADLGPNLTHLGSLATFLWLFFLRRKGLDVSTWDYLRIGILVTPFMLPGAIIGLWLTSGR
jgi:arsenical pump membrane protein